MKNSKSAKFNKSKISKKSMNNKFKDKEAPNRHPNMHANGNVVQGGKNAKMDQKSSSVQVHTNFQPRLDSNDPSWYSLTPQLVATGANISYNAALGTLTNLVGYYGQQGQMQNKLHHQVPGIMTVNMQPTFGPATSANSPINIAARSIFATIRRSINGSRPYEAADVINYIMAVGSMYAAVTHVMRAITATRSFEILNRYSRETLVAAMGYDYYDFVSNLGNTIFHLNIVIKQLNLLPIPNHMNIFNRWIWLNSHIFKDEDTPKAQYYIPNVNMYYAYTYNPKPAPGYGPVELIPQRIISGEKPASIYETLKSLQDIISVMNQDSDIALISGDILKTYGGDIFQLPLLDSAAMIEPTVDHEWNMQLHNAIVSENYIAKYRSRIDKESTYIEQELTNYATDHNTLDKVLIDCNFATPTPIDNMILTRLTTHVVNNNDINEPAFFGTEIVTSITISEYIGDEGSEWTQIYNTNGLYSANTFLLRIHDVSRVSVFKYKPLMYAFLTDAEGEGTGFYITGDIDTYAWISPSVLNNMHETAIYSQLGLGEYGSGVLNGSKDRRD